MTIHYDPMLGKLIAWGADRETAIRRLRRALSELRIEGIKTNVPLFAALLEDADFRAGELDIGMLDRKLAAGELAPSHSDEASEIAVMATALEYLEKRSRRAASPMREDRRHAWREVGRTEAIGGKP